jgi:threonine-phosphate decarboxylase
MNGRKKKSDPDIPGNCGDIHRLAEELKIQERAIIDFSTPASPLGVSKKVKAELRKHLKYLHHYPDPEAERLKKRLAQDHGIDPETILCGNGSIELIYLLARALRPRKILIPEPTFSEYERACRMTNHELHVIRYELKEETNFDINPEEFISAMSGTINSSLITHHSSPPFDMVFLCNPNTPTGRPLKRDGIMHIADAAKKFGYYLVVDEAFIDFIPDDSVIRDVADNPHLIVLRSMAPFYALSGLRLGYGVFPRHLVHILKEHKEPWTVNSLAQRAAVIALKDKVYRRETLRSIQDEKKYLEKNFKKIGMAFLPSAANFYLVKMDGALETCRQLKKKGILLCECSDCRGLDRTHIRIAVKSHRENTILIRELKKILQRGQECLSVAG